MNNELLSDARLASSTQSYSSTSTCMPTMPILLGDGSLSQQDVFLAESTYVYC